jgi:outer membrane receptor protein involved in Fe transport
VGSQYLIHDDSNQFAKVPAYATLNLHTSYQLTPNVELFGMINNVLNQHYYVAGTFTGLIERSVITTTRQKPADTSQVGPLPR